GRAAGRARPLGNAHRQDPGRQLPPRDGGGLAMKHLLLVLALVAGTATAREDQVQIHGTSAGTQTLTAPEPGVTAADYRFNDRGRGDVIQARWRLDARGLPLSYEAHGN